MNERWAWKPGFATPVLAPFLPPPVVFTVQRKRAALSGGPLTWLLRQQLLRSHRAFDLRRRVRCRLFLDRLVALGCDMAQPGDGAAGTGGDETSHDHVLLEAF